MIRRRYANLDGIETKKTFNDLMKWRRERRAKKFDSSYQIPVATAKDVGFLQTNRQEPTITWIGHSTFFIQLSGLNILTDPVWATRMGMEKRLSPPGIRIEELPAVDVVLISHGHYDHLHYPSLKKLKGDVLFLVPEGLRAAFEKKALRNTKEFPWWASTEVNDVTFHFVPAQHWTRRTLFDMNTSHWGGWVMEKGQQTIYFAGDSGYFRGFQEIGDRFAIDYALMPIGAYEPEWFMSPSHITPEEAVLAFGDLRAAHFIPMHYGAFRLADDHPQEALERLHSAWSESGMAPDRLHVMVLGETLRIALP